MNTSPIRRPLRTRLGVPVAAAAVLLGTTGCSDMITMDFSGSNPDLGEPIDFDALGDQLDVASNRVPAVLFDRMGSDADSFDPALGLDPVQWLAESPSGIAGVDAMMAAFYLPITDDAAITNPDLDAWFRGAIKNGKMASEDLASFQQRLAQAWAASPAIAGIAPATIQFLKPADAAAFVERAAAIALAYQVATGKDTFGAAMEAIEQRGDAGFVNAELGAAAYKAHQQLGKDVNAAVEKRQAQVDLLANRAQSNGTPGPNTAPTPERSLTDAAKTARFTAFFASVATAPTPAPVAGR